MPKSKVLFLLADGARARFVERSPDTGHFVTVQEIDSRDKLRTLRKEARASQPSWTTQQGLPGGDALNQQDYFRVAKEAFAVEIAEKAAAMLEKRAYQGVFLAAPARLIGILRRGLAGKANITGEINRDLTKAPDSELGRWLPTPGIAAPAS
jgi:protein required for attachment to host cells